MKRPPRALLLERAETAREALLACDLCARMCRTHRIAAPESGYCKLDDTARVYKELISYGEEPSVSPTWLLDLSGCSLRCLFCTEWQHVVRPRAGKGVTLSGAWLEQRRRSRQEAGARTLTVVGGEPTVNVAAVLQALAELPEGTWLPVVWNTNGLLSETSYALLEGVVATWTVDLKLVEGDWLGGAPLDYLDVVSGWLDRLYLDRQRVGHGLIIRHLLMPGALESDTVPLLDEVRERWPKATLNLMTQYLPFGPALTHRDRVGALKGLVTEAERSAAVVRAQKHPGPLLIDGRAFAP